jgi:hypothetical protein
MPLQQDIDQQMEEVRQRVRAILAGSRLEYSDTTRPGIDPIPNYNINFTGFGIAEPTKGKRKRRILNLPEWF